jgi:hypothetical protein
MATSELFTDSVDIEAKPSTQRPCYVDTTGEVGPASALNGPVWRLAVFVQRRPRGRGRPPAELPQIAGFAMMPGGPASRSAQPRVRQLRVALDRPRARSGCGVRTRLAGGPPERPGPSHPDCSRPGRSLPLAGRPTSVPSSTRARAVQGGPCGGSGTCPENRKPHGVRRAVGRPIPAASAGALRLGLGPWPARPNARSDS